MKAFRTLTLSYCLACLATGAVREMIPEGESRKVIKTISGLYILLAVLHALGTAGPLSLSAVSLPASGVPAVSGSYESAILAQAQANLEADCRDRLAALGIEGSAAIQLSCSEGAVCVESVTLSCEKTLSPEQKQQAEAVALSYAPVTIAWADKAAEQ